MRIEYTRDRDPAILVTLRYESKPAPQNLSGWEYAGFTFGSIAQTDSARSFRIDLECDVSDKDFVIEFPIGTHIVDTRSNKEVHVRPIGNGEFEPWRKSELPHPMGRTTQAIVIGLVAVVVVTVTIVIRRRSKKWWHITAGVT
jgi:hypothetical protein